MTALVERRDHMLPDHVAAGRNAAVLTRIADVAINLAIWERRLAPELADGIDAADLTRLARYDAVVTPEAINSGLNEHLLRSGLTGPLAAALAIDAGALAISFAEIMSVDRVTLRLERITGDACKRFHADYMSVRLITTYRGAGTEWLACADGSRVIEGRATDDACIHRLGAGAVAMMKGRLRSPDRPLIHRSPPITTSGQDRLVLVIDVPPVPRD